MTLNKKATLKKIIEKCQTSIAYSIDLDKLEQYKNDESFILEAAEFCRIEPVYK